jgi:hypothetical protein
MTERKKTTKNDEEDAPQNEETVKVKNENRGRFIKYMGTSDIRRLDVGETLLWSVEPLQSRLEWNAQTNRHVINTADYPDVPDEFWNRLVCFDDFKDVTAAMSDPKKEVPKSGWEEIWSKEALQSDWLWVPPPPRIDQ